jgi:hypothetical protein
VKEPGGYFLVRAKGQRETPAARAFREWVLAEMADTQRRFAGLKTVARTASDAKSPSGAAA